MWMVRVKQAFGVLILLVAAWYAKEAYSLFSERWVEAGDVEASAEALDAEGWTSSLADGLAAGRAENKPVIIDFWATWCKSCQTMNLTTFKSPQVVARLDGYVKVKFQAEDMSAEPTRSILEHYSVKGLPTYIFLAPKP
jgi:thiol:disulfide interchange protein